MWKNKSRYADYLCRILEARGNIEQRSDGRVDDGMRNQRVIYAEKKEKYFESCIYHKRLEERNFPCHRGTSKPVLKVDFRFVEKYVSKDSYKRAKRVLCIKEDFSHTRSRGQVCSFLCLWKYTRYESSVCKIRLHDSIWTRFLKVGSHGVDFNSSRQFDLTRGKCSFLFWMMGRRAFFPPTPPLSKMLNHLQIGEFNAFLFTLSGKEISIARYRKFSFESSYRNDSKY